jgi:hypothetical protein
MQPLWTDQNQRIPIGFTVENLRSLMGISARGSPSIQVSQRCEYAQQRESLAAGDNHASQSAQMELIRESLR